ncbi:MAG TPA: protein kinase [Planctomycetota bacterium]|nr:protein kinase [Planctomycetota bacterium]
MKRIYCTDTHESIPPEYFLQGKAVFCEGKPYYAIVARRLGLKADTSVPREYAGLIAEAAMNQKPARKTRITRTVKKTNSTRKLYCTETYEYLPPEAFAQGKAVWCGGKPYLASAAQRRGFLPDPAPPPGFDAESATQKTAAAPAAPRMSNPPTPPPIRVNPPAQERVSSDGKTRISRREEPPLAASVDVASGDMTLLVKKPAQPQVAPSPPAHRTPQPVPQPRISAPPVVDDSGEMTLPLKRNEMRPAPPPIPHGVTPPPLRRNPVQAVSAPSKIPSTAGSEPAANLRQHLNERQWPPAPPLQPQPVQAMHPQQAPPQPPAVAVAPVGARKGLTSIGLVIGQKLLGRYMVKKVLGTGAMGEVLLVTDQQSGIDFALKRLPPAIAAQKMESVRSNFHLTSGLTHPHIAATRNIEMDPKTKNAYVLMDLVRGQDMANWLIAERTKRGGKTAPLPIELVLGIAEQIASALDYAHSMPVSYGEDGQPTGYGILHRDLKPANVMVENGRLYRSGVPFVRIVDFGLATESQASLEDLSLPQRNKKAGTPVYMAPEQWEGRTLTRGVDQWALAVMIYEMLAGKRPFYDETEYKLMEKIFQASPERPAALTPRQFAALQKTFSVDRRQRHRSCLALVKAIANAERATKNLILAAELPMPEDLAAQIDD